eukprot:COSAG01_NODE_23624_length_808_cov_1.091678_1_plen_89_part_10
MTHPHHHHTTGMVQGAAARCSDCWRLCVHCSTVQAPGAKRCNTSTPAAATAELAYSVHLEPGIHYVGSADQASAAHLGGANGCLQLTQQ